MNNFGFSDEQAEAIVMMQLYRLSTQDITQLMEEDKELNDNIKRYEKILNSEKELIKVIIKELSDLNKTLVCPRRTTIDANATSNIKFDEADLITKEQVIVSVSRDGYLKRTSLKSYNSSKQNGLKENDAVLFLGEVSTLDTLLIFTTLGNFVYIPVHKIAECKFKDVGTYVNSIVAIQPKEKFIKVFPIADFNSGHTLLLATKTGQMKQTLLSEFNVNRYTKPVRAMKLASDDSLVAVDMIDTPLEIMVFTKNCEALRFRASDISLYGTNAGGIRSINLKPKDYVISALYTNKEEDILLLTSRSTLKRMRVTDVVLTKRSRAGSALIKPIKSNPCYLIDVSAMTPNQFKENVLIDVRYKDGNDSIEAKSLKYNVSDIGKSIENKELHEIQALRLPAPVEKDKPVSPDYLIEVKDSIFNYEDDSAVEVPIQLPKKQPNILDELDAILAKENKNVETKKSDVKITENDKYIVKETKSSLFIREKEPEKKKFKIDESDNIEFEKEIKYTKISLFDED